MQNIIHITVKYIPESKQDSFTRTERHFEGSVDGTDLTAKAVSEYKLVDLLTEFTARKLGCEAFRVQVGRVTLVDFPEADYTVRMNQVWDQAIHEDKERNRKVLRAGLETELKTRLSAAGITTNVCYVEQDCNRIVVQAVTHYDRFSRREVSDIGRRSFPKNAQNNFNWDKIVSHVKTVQTLMQQREAAEKNRLHADEANQAAIKALGFSGWNNVTADASGIHVKVNVQNADKLTKVVAVLRELGIEVR